MLAYILWDPNPIALTLPVVHHPVAWYGILFAVGFFLGYFIARHGIQIIFSAQPDAKQLATKYTDRLLWFTAIGTVVGARLGHVFFYEWERYRHNLFDIVKVWQGGLASHGAVIGVVLSVILFLVTSRKKFPRVSFFQLFDVVVVAGALIGMFIRLGNFVNQELVGTVSEVPWAIIFAHPADGGMALPRHPVQLYESISYGLIFMVLYVLYHLQPVRKRAGLVSGLALVMVFSMRFCLEFVKARFTSVVDADSTLAMGQLLSIPLIAIGLLIVLTTLVRSQQIKRS